MPRYWNLLQSSISHLVCVDRPWGICFSPGVWMGHGGSASHLVCVDGSWESAAASAFSGSVGWESV